LINLEKVTLNKHESIDLAKGESFDDIMVNLNWSRAAPKKTGFFSKLVAPKDIDLDLGCLYSLKNGDKSAIQALGNAFGSFNSAPFVELMGDDRSGANADGEFMRINGKQWSKIDRVLIYAFIYEGAPDWNSTDGVVTINVQGQAPVEVRMSGDSSQRCCGIAMLENINGAVRVTRQNEYHSDQRKLDQANSWGLQWGHGSK
jgi:tellurite resistance protein TerA